MGYETLVQKRGYRIEVTTSPGYGDLENCKTVFVTLSVNLPQEFILSVVEALSLYREGSLLAGVNTFTEHDQLIFNEAAAKFLDEHPRFLNTYFGVPGAEFRDPESFADFFTNFGIYGGPTNTRVVEYVRVVRFDEPVLAMSIIEVESFDDFPRFNKEN